MFDGNTFFPVTGTPIRKIACMISPLADADPVPLAVAILNAKSLIRCILETATGYKRVSKPGVRVLAVDSPTSLEARKTMRRVTGLELKRGGPVNGHPRNGVRHDRRDTLQNRIAGDRERGIPTRRGAHSRDV